MADHRHLLLFAALLVAAPVVAQDLSLLPDRPIARSEVAAVVKRQVAAMDSNHDGAVSWAEFERYRAAQAGAPPATGVAALAHVGSHWFERGDADGDGRVTLAEAEAHPLELFDTADANHDGTVSLAERKVATLLLRLGGH